MKLHLIFLFSLLIGLSLVNSCEIHSDEELVEGDDYDLPSDYETYSKEEKYEYIQDMISRYPKNTRWMPEKGDIIVERNNNITFDKFQDEMPLQDPETGEIREKLVHTVGLSSGMEWESVGDHPYTGNYKGSKYGILRFTPIDKQEVDSFSISYGIKCFRDGQVSGNLFFVFSMLGQETNSNPFWNDLSNFPPFPAELNDRLEAFLKVTDFITLMGNSQFAEYDEDGNKEENVRFPFRVIMHPTNEIRYHFANDLDMSPEHPFYIPLLDGFFREHIYDIYAQDNPFSEDVQLIAKLKMRTPFETSSYADKKLFYGHTRFEVDLEYRPEWEEPVHEKIEFFRSQQDPFYRENLQFNH